MIAAQDILRPLGTAIRRELRRVILGAVMPGPRWAIGGDKTHLAMRVISSKSMRSSVHKSGGKRVDQDQCLLPPGEPQRRCTIDEGCAEPPSDTGDL